MATSRFSRDVSGARTSEGTLANVGSAQRAELAAKSTQEQAKEILERYQKGQITATQLREAGVTPEQLKSYTQSQQVQIQQQKQQDVKQQQIQTAQQLISNPLTTNWDLQKAYSQGKISQQQFNELAFTSRGQSVSKQEKQDMGFFETITKEPKQLLSPFFDISQTKKQIETEASKTPQGKATVEKYQKGFEIAETYAPAGAIGFLTGGTATAAAGMVAFTGITKKAEEKYIQPLVESIFQKEAASKQKQLDIQFQKASETAKQELQTQGKLSPLTSEYFDVTKAKKTEQGQEFIEYSLIPKESKAKSLYESYSPDFELTTLEKGAKLTQTTAGRIVLSAAEIGAALLITKSAGKLTDFTLSKLPTQVKGVLFEPEMYITKIEKEASKQMGDFLITSPEITKGKIVGTARLQTSKLGIFNKKDLEIPAMLEFEQIGKEAGIVKTESKLFVLGKEGEQFAGAGKGIIDFTTKEGKISLKDFTMQGAKTEFGGISETTFKVSGKQKETLLRQIKDIDKDIAKTKATPLKKITYEEKTKQIRKLLTQKQAIRDYLEKPIVKRNLLEGSTWSFEELPKYKISKATSIEVKEPKTIFERGFLKIERGEQITPDIFKTTKMPKTTSYNIFEKGGKVPTEVIEKEVLGLKFIEEDLGLKDIQILYHGTTEKSAEKILKEGLKPTRETGITRGITKPSLAKKVLPISDFESVYLTPDFGAARGFAGRAVMKEGGKPAVLEINIPKGSIEETDKLGKFLFKEVKLPSVKPEQIKGIVIKPLSEMPSGKFMPETKEVSRSLEMQDIYQGAGVIEKAKVPFELKFEVTTPKHLPYEEKVIEFGKPKVIEGKDLTQELLTKQLPEVKTIQPTGAIISKNILDTQIRNMAFQVPYEPQFYQRTPTAQELIFLGLPTTARLPRANELIIGGISEHIKELKGFNLPVPSTELKTEFKFISAEKGKDIFKVPSKDLFSRQEMGVSLVPLTSQAQGQVPILTQGQLSLQTQITEQPQPEKLKHPQGGMNEFFSITVPIETFKAPLIPILPWFPHGRLFERGKKGKPVEVTPEYKPSLMALELGIKGKATKETLQKKELTGLQIRKLPKGFKFEKLPSLNVELNVPKLFGRKKKRKLF